MLPSLSCVSVICVYCIVRALQLFAVRCGHSWMLVGTGVNTACLVMVAGMTEKRMLGNWPAKRKKLYEEYIAATPCIFPTLGSVCRSKTKAA